MKQLLKQRRASERGATLVEYALVVVLFAGASASGIAAVDQKSDEYFNETADIILDNAPYDHDWSELTTTTSATTSTTAAPTTTTAAPTTTTAAPTTTTTAAPTTTTAAPTTTTAAPNSVVSLTGSSSWFFGYYATVNVRVTSTTGANVGGATVSGAFAPGGNKSCTTAANGTCSFYVYMTGSSTTYTVSSVSANPTWNGAPASVTITR